MLGAVGWVSSQRSIWDPETDKNRLEGNGGES